MPLPTANLGDVQLRPQASPIDTYVRPTQAGPGLGAQLASALKDYEPQIQQFLNAKKAQADDATDQSARRQALLDGVQDVKKVQDGSLHPDQSKLWQKIYKDQQGRAYAVAQVASARQQYDDGGYANQENPQDFQTFLKGFTQSALQDLKDPDMLGGARPALEQEITRLTLSNQAATAENQKNGYINSAATELDGLIGNEANAAATEGRAFDATNVWGSINALKARSKGLGMLNGQEVNKLVVDTATDYAIRNADHSPLDALKGQKWTDKDGNATPGPFDSAYGRNKLRDTQQQVDARRVELANQLWTFEQRGKTKAREDAMAVYASKAAAGQRLSASELSSMTATLGADFLTNYNSALTSINGVVTSDRTLRDYDSAQKMSGIYSDLLSGKMDTQDKIGAMASIRDPNTVGRFYDDAKADENGKTVFQRLRHVDDGVALLLDDVAKAGVDDSIIGKALGSNPDIVRSAKTSIARDVAAFAQANPTVLQGDRTQVRALQDLLDQRLSYWKQYAAAREGQGAAAPNAKGAPPKPKPTPTNAAAAPGAVAGVTDQSKVPPSLRTTTPTP